MSPTVFKEIKIRTGHYLFMETAQTSDTEEEILFYKTLTNSN